MSKTTRDILDTLERDYKKPEQKAAEIAQKPDILNAVSLYKLILLSSKSSSLKLIDNILFKAHYSTGRVAASFTSTAMVPVLEHEAAILEENEIRYERINKKGKFNVLVWFHEKENIIFNKL